MKHFGQRLRALRKNGNITQEALAEYLDISYQAVSKWENGLGFPDISLLPAISNFFGVSADYLLGIEPENSEDKIQKVLQEAQKFTHTGEIEKSIAILEEALKQYPNDHRLLSNYIEYQLMRPPNGAKWLNDIETKANLILRDCRIDKIRQTTIGNLAYAYVLLGKQEKASETIELLPDSAYSKKRLISMAVPEKERAKYKPECILHETKLLLVDILAVAKHHIFWGNPHIAVDICNKALSIVDSVGAEGYLLYIQANIYRFLVLAHSKLQNTDAMYLAAEKVLEIHKETETLLSNGGASYTSPLLDGLYFSKKDVKYSSSMNSFELYFNFLTKAKALEQYKDDPRFQDILKKLKREIDFHK